MQKSLDELFEQRLQQNSGLLYEKFISLYGKCDEHYEQLVGVIKEAYGNRKDDLKVCDRNRGQNLDWYMDERMIGISIYVDLFADNLIGVKDKISYFKELGITYIHFMPILKTRGEKDDGGFAVSSYKEINRKLGTMDQFEKLVDALREEGIVTCIDFVLNHTAKEHDWAVKAVNGEEKYQNMYYMYDSDDIPKEFEKSLPLIFPEVSQQNFIYSNEIDKWIFSIFYDYQWDLNYKNPILFNHIVESMLFLLNRGVDILRLDALPHIWKEMGTDCFNLPQVHDILTMLNIIVNMVAPGSLFKGEAIGSTEIIMDFFGEQFKGCSLMYNFPLSVSLWNALVSEDVREMKISLSKLNDFQNKRCFINYIRSHDDIAWDLDKDIMKSLGIDYDSHTEYIKEYYIGNIPESFSKGESKKFDKNAKEGRKTSGTVASLCGLERAVEEHNKFQIDLAIKKILLLHSFILSYEGIPMIYGGDEIGMFNDLSYKYDSNKADDSRWLHRVHFDWTKAERRKQVEAVEGQIFQGLKFMIELRKKYKIFSSEQKSTFFDTGNNSVIGFYKKNNSENLLVLCNFSGRSQDVQNSELNDIGLVGSVCNILNNQTVNLDSRKITLQSYEVIWLIDFQSR